MTTRPTLLLDMDGPLADFDLHFWSMCEKAGFHIDLDSLDDPRRKRFLTDNMRYDRHRQLARNYVEDSCWFRYLPITEGASRGVPELMEHFDVWVCTKPLEANRTCRDDKAMWLRRHFPELEHRLIIAPDKSLVHGSVLLDDAPKWKWIGRASWMPVLFLQPYNAPGTSLGRLGRHWSWGDPLDLLHETAELAAARYHTMKGH